ncbi:TlpA disulfide reductase family protein [Prevotella communis]|uniref:TlpA disulfide reductase family protein n=1 Tax=Prevotella communis TaxID=2913614 RepID=UPI001EDA0A7F|nr:TlpA disulfide reductase family protein [Prevotella communis]UKK56467.1 AhpC/TSA family protein [Prevotella communis]UKK59227.1 AhpC/TSA family protein [Prevotella communis]UKK61994.1 AhpC/TSA family protein [Prevotella communis]UKK64821.1 AhpC/TSA family protein [Prevotella communis]
MKSFIITILLTLVSMTGHGEIKCHVVGTVADGVKRQTFYVAQQGTADDDDAKWTEIKVKDGHFALDIEAETTEMYEIIEDHKEGGHFALFLVENDTVRITITPDDEGARLDVVAGGPEQEKWLEMQRMSKGLFGQEAEMIESKLDSLEDNDLLDTPEGRKLVQAHDSLKARIDAWMKAYKADHPMLYGLLYLEVGMLYAYDDINEARPYLDEYHQLYEHLFPKHPAHRRIALKELGLQLQPGQPYFNDYEAATADGEKVSVGTLYRGRVTLIIMWASWCNSCRGHAKLLIPLYEKYHDAGLNVVAIAREWNMKSFRLAMKRDKYPWPSLVDYQDCFGVWEKHAKKNGSGKFLLIDRDGTILSTSFDAQELEPIIKKALNIE